jgi:hypothetical protein
VAGEWWRWRARGQRRELDGNCGERSDRLLFQTEGEGVRCRAGGCMRGAWSGSGGWSAASAVRWRVAAQLSRTRGQHLGAGSRHCTWVAVACVARGSREAGGRGRQGRHSTAGGHDRALSEYVPHAVGLSGWYCSTRPGPIGCTVLFFQLFKLCSNFKIQKEDHPDIKNY